MRGVDQRRFHAQALSSRPEVVEHLEQRTRDAGASCDGPTLSFRRLRGVGLIEPVTDTPRSRGTGGLPMRPLALSDSDINVRSISPARPSAPVTVYAPGAPRALYVVGASPAELANLDTRELARIARREAA